jgi:hypothetical protein
MFYPMNFLRRCCRSGILFLALLLLAPAGRLQAQESLPSEYQVKAAFLFNFAKFVTWPAGDFAGPDAPLVIGVYGDDPFHGDLKIMVAGKRIKGHPVVFRLVTAPANAKSCHILFVSASAQKDAADVLGALHGANVLTVTENMAHFAKSGFAIEFVTEQDKIRFEINDAAAAQAGLAVSSKLMALAKPLEQ